MRQCIILASGRAFVYNSPNSCQNTREWQNTQLTHSHLNSLILETKQDSKYTINGKILSNKDFCNKINQYYYYVRVYVIIKIKQSVQLLYLKYCRAETSTQQDRYKYPSTRYHKLHVIYKSIP